MSLLVVAANGPLPSRSNQASPGPLVPNGKPTSPYNERSNPISSSAQIAAQTVSSRDPKAAAQAASDMRNVVRRKLTGYVGFANLPNQWHRKSVRKGFNFNVMVVGGLLKIPCFQQTIDNSVQVNRDLGNPPSSIPFSIPPSILPRNARVLASTFRQRLSPYNQLVQISRRTVFVYDSQLLIPLDLVILSTTRIHGDLSWTILSKDLMLISTLKTKLIG